MRCPIDYRNLPFKFAFGGLNILAAPENVPEGQFTRFQNVRYRREGTLEARPGTEDFFSLVEQTKIGDPTAGNDNSFPAIWDLKDLLKAHYVGKVAKGIDKVDAWVTIHTLPASPSGNASLFRVFLNGRPLQLFNDTYTCPVTTVLPVNPTSISVIRAYSKSGQPVIIIDGIYYFVPGQVDLNDTTQFTLTDYTTTTITDDIPTVPTYLLSITAPPTPTGAAGAGAGSLSGTYQYGITYYNTLTGFESELAISAAFTAATTNDTGTVGGVKYSADPQVDTIRYWRKGGTLSSWRLLTTAANLPCSGGSAVADYTDTIADATIALAETIEETWKREFVTVNDSGDTVVGQPLNYAWGPFLGKYLFWVGDPVKKGHIYWNISGDASRYDWIDGVNSVTDAGEILQNGFLFFSLPFVFSRLNLYALDYGGPDATPQFTPRLVSIGMGLAGKWAFAVGPAAVFFLGRDGIYMTDCQPNPPVSLTETTIKPIFQGISREDLSALDWSKVDEFRMTVTAKELHFFYTGMDTYKHHLVFDFERQAWSNWSNNTYVSGYADEGAPTTRVIFGTKDSKEIRSLDDSRPTYGTETFVVAARTGAIDHSIPLTFKEYGVLQLDADLNTITITFNPYYNSESVTGTPINFVPDNPESPTRRDYSHSLSDFYARNISLEFTWTETPTNHPILYQGQLQFREDEERLVHWEMPPTTLGQNGWFHLKDAYLTIRSDDEVILTVVIDGTTTDTYRLASTGGERLTRYVEFKARRGKVFQFKLNSKTPPTGGAINPKAFRFYGEDSMLRGKPWLTGATYQPINPFGAAGYAEYRRTEGGT